MLRNSPRTTQRRGTAADATDQRKQDPRKGKRREGKWTLVARNEGTVFLDLSVVTFLLDRMFVCDRLLGIERICILVTWKDTTTCSFFYHRNL